MSIKDNLDWIPVKCQELSVQPGTGFDSLDNLSPLSSCEIQEDTLFLRRSSCPKGHSKADCSATLPKKVPHWFSLLYEKVIQVPACNQWEDYYPILIKCSWTPTVDFAHREGYPSSITKRFDVKASTTVEDLLAKT